MRMFESRWNSKNEFKKGEVARILEGPFADYVGFIEEINLERETVKMIVSFFGRETPVELGFLQIEKL